MKGWPTASLPARSRSSCASRMRRNKIHVSSGTYCKALAQFERRIMSQMDLTKEERDCVEAIARGARGAFAVPLVLGLDIVINQKRKQTAFRVPALAGWRRL